MATKKRGKRAAGSTRANGSSRSTLTAVLAALAETFTSSVLNAIRSVTLEELAAVSAGSPRTKTARAPSIGASPKIATTAGIGGASIGRVLHALEGKKDGLRSEELRAALGITKAKLTPVLRRGVADGSLKTTGQRRGMRYRAAVPF